MTNLFRTVLVSTFLILAYLAGVSESSASTLPPGFQETVVFSGHYRPVSVRFAPNGNIFVGEKSGLLWVYEDLNDTTPTLVIDLRAQVHSFWDRGMLGLAIDPAYPLNPYLYVLYAFDAFADGTFPRWGTGGGSPSTDDPCPSPPGATSDGCVVYGKLSRIEIDLPSMAGTEQPLLSQNWCAQYPSHSIGDLDFGQDGYLYLSAGDGASFNFADWGQDGNPINPCDDPPDGIGGPNNGLDAEGGALRSQDILTPSDRTDLDPGMEDPTSFDGAVLRIDVSSLPVQAPADNPLVSLNTAPDDDFVVANGLRNPFRITARPGTDEIWIADVGWGTWEEINRIIDPTGTVDNFGWPCYEGNNSGSAVMGNYQNRDLCQDLYIDNIPLGIDTIPPHYAYRHSDKVVPGELCGTGSSSITGVAFNTSSNYPVEYQDALFFADSSRKCIWTMFADLNGDPDKNNRAPLVSQSTGRVVDIQMGSDGFLYYVDHDGGNIYRIDYFSQNEPPIAIASANPTSGITPLLVQFDGSTSSDAEDGSNLIYAWDLDGDSVFDDSALVNPSYTYTQSGVHVAQLRVEDTEGDYGYDSVIITGGNTPPTATITSPSPTLEWAVGDLISVTGEASDPQDGPLPASQLSWEIILHHCVTLEDCHTHPVTSLSGVSSFDFDSPDHELESFLEIKLTATDLPPADWFDENWPLRRKLNFDNSAQTETLVNFPVLVVLDASRIDYGQTQPGGVDLRFVSNGVELGYEIETWDPAGLSYIWVKVDSIDGASAGDYIHMYYGNPSATFSVEDPVAVWSNGYAAVWHMRDDLTDSTGNSNHAVDNGTSGSFGQIGPARSFDGSSHLEISSSPSIEITGQLSLEAWVGIDDPNQGGAPRVLSKKFNWDDDGYNMEYKPVDNNVTVVGSGGDYLRASGIDLDTNWHYLAATVNGGTGAIYVDGQDQTNDFTIGPLVATSQSLSIGRRGDGAEHFLGDIDEVRISNVERSADWMAAQYLSMIDGLIFYGPEESPSTLSDTTTLELYPKRVTLSFNSLPQGLDLVVGGRTVATPFTQDFIVGALSTVSAPSPQTIGSNEFSFDSWSDGGAQTHLITAPAAPDSLVATFSSPTANPPVVAITSPSDGSGFAEGASIGFSGTATDVEDGDLTAGLSWSSDVDGVIGTGGSFSAVLSPGPHTITASVTDSDSLTVSNSIVVTLLGDPWWDTNWTERAKIEFQTTGLLETLVDFTTLVKLDPSRLDYSLAQSLGQDIRFVDADGVTLLPYEIESWQSLGDSHLWVRVPQIDGNSTSDYIWLYYGNPSAADTQDPGGVWAGDHRAIWHLDDDLLDIAGNGHNGANQGSVDETGVIAGGQRFDGINDVVIVPHAPTLSFTASDSYTLSAWVNVESLPGSWTGVVTKSRDQSPWYGIWISSQNQWVAGASSGQNLKAGSVAIGWNHLTVVQDGPAGQRYLYVNGIQIGSGTSAPASGSGDLWLGGSGGVNEYFDGVIDQVQLESVARSSDWIAAQLLSHNDSLLVYPDGNQVSTVTIQSPSDGSSFVEATSIAFVGSASDPEDGDLTSSLSWSSDLDGTIGTGGSPSAVLSIGTHTITASVVDSGGKPGSDSITVTVNANTAPSVSITAPADGASFGQGTLVDFSGSANDVDDGDLTPSLSWSSDLDGAIGSGGSPSAVLSPGTHIVTASVVDSHAAPGSDVVTVIIIVPGPPVVAITSPSDGSGFAEGASIGFSGTATDVEDGDLTAGLSWSSDVDGVIGTGGSFSAVLSPGPHTITASVTDSDSLIGTDSITVTVSQDPWWDTNWTERAKIEFQTTGLLETLVDFTTLVKLDPSRLDYSLAQSLGQDIRFVDADGVTLLPYEIESWQSLGDSHLWVRVPQIDGNSTSDYIWLYYGNPSAADTQDPGGVWAGDHRAIWHLDDDLLDIAGNGHNGANQGSVDETGVIAGGQRFDGINDVVIVPHAPTLSFTASDSYTLSAWVNVESLPGSWTGVVTKSRDQSPWYGIWISSQNQWVAGASSGQNLKAGSVAIGWNHLTVVQDGPAGQRYLYVNGIQIGSGTSAPASGSGDLWLGGSGGVNEYFDGVIDQVQLESVARSSDWIAAQLLSHNDSLLVYPDGNQVSTVTIQSPSDGSSFVEATSIAFVGSASDPEDGDLTSSLSWSSDLDGTIGTGGSPSAVLSIGTHTITASVVDSGGKPGSDSITVTVNANTAPSVSITAPADGASFGQGTLVDFSGSANDVDDGDLTPSLSWSSDLDGAIGSGGSPSAVLSPGTHIVTASVVDSHAAPGSDVVTVIIIVPGPPVVAITSPSDGSGFAEGASIGFSGTATDVEDGDLTAGLSWSSDVDGVIGTGGSFSAVLSPGPHTITASVTDSDSLIGTDSITVTVSQDPWWDTNWTERAKIEFQTTGLLETLVDFTTLVKLDPSRLDYSLAQSLGQDIRFVDADGVTLLPYEIESWQSLGDSHLWVRVPQIDGNSTSDYIWLYYGNPSAADTQDPGGVWAGDHRAIWHLDDDLLDIAGNGHNGANQGSVDETGVIAGGQRFDGINDVVIVPHAPTLSFTASDSYTLSAWVNVESLPGSWTGVVTKSRDQSPWYGIWISSQNQWVAGASSGQNLKAGSVAIGWNHLTVVQDGPAGQRYLYVNGIQIGSGTSAPASGSGDLWLGGSGGVNEYFDGVIDQVQLESVARSSDWIAAQLLSHNDSLLIFSAQSSP